jgi:hypothetical protein
VGSIVITTVAPWTASGADAATTTPASASGPVADADRSHTLVVGPRQIGCGSSPIHDARADHRHCRAGIPSIRPCHHGSFPAVGPPAVGE